MSTTRRGYGGRWNWFARWVLGSTAALCVVLWVVSLFVFPSAGLGLTASVTVAGGNVVADHWPAESVRGLNVSRKQLNIDPVTFAPGAAYLESSIGLKDMIRVMDWLPRAEQKDTNGMWPYYEAALPLWIPFLLCVVPAVMAWRTHIRRRRTGRCPTCGYDLAGLAVGAVCPECGGLRG